MTYETNIFCSKAYEEIEDICEAGTKFITYT
jgi:hypothetical protein